MSIVAHFNTEFFRFKLPGESTWTIPTVVSDGTDGITISSNWSTVNVQGSTEAMSAFNYVNNPTLNIQLYFHEDLWRDAAITDHTYEETIAKLASLQYPGGISSIEPPYVTISWNRGTPGTHVL